MGIFDNKPSKDQKRPPLQGRPKMEPTVRHHICTPWCAQHSKREPKK